VDGASPSATPGAGQVRLRLGAPVGLLASPWPVYEIWRRHRDDAATDLVPAGGGNRLVICRSGWRPRVEPVSEPVLALLGAVAAGLTLAALAAAGQAVESLGGFIAGGIIAGVEVAGAPLARLVSERLYGSRAAAPPPALPPGRR
jgi:hypothetical protein